MKITHFDPLDLNRTRKQYLNFIFNSVRYKKNRSALSLCKRGIFFFWECPLVFSPWRSLFSLSQMKHICTTNIWFVCVDRILLLSYVPIPDHENMCAWQMTNGSNDQQSVAHLTFQKRKVVKWPTTCWSFDHLKLVFKLPTASWPIYQPQVSFYITNGK